MWTRPDRLETDLLIMRPPVIGDADDLVRHIGDWDVVGMLRFPPWPYTRSDAVAFISSEMSNDSLAIVYQGSVIGSIGISALSGRDSIGYWIGRDFWGRGLATEACGAVIADYFETGSGDVLYSSLLAENTASLRLQKKLGFVHMQNVRTFVVARGEEVDAIDTRLTRTAFESRRT